MNRIEKKKFWCYLFLCVASLSMLMQFSACSKDDEDVVDGDGLVGTWEIIASKGYEIEDGERNDDWDLKASDLTDVLERFSFQENGTYTYSYFSHYSGRWIEDERGTWKIVGHRLLLDDGEDEVDEVTIASVTSTRLILSNHEKKPGYEYYVENTYKRIN